MPRIPNKLKAERNKKLWQHANTTERTKWLTRSQKGYDFYLDDQLTADERKTIEEAGMPTFNINRITPIVEIMRYFVTANNPRWKAVGREGSDSDIAQVHSDIADYCWYISGGKSVYSQVVLDALAKGVGYFFIHVDKDMDNGKGEVVFSSLQPYDVFVDPMSRDILFRDASFISVRKRFSRTQLLNFLPEHAAKIKKAAGNDSEVIPASQRDMSQTHSIQTDEIISSVTTEGEYDDLLDYYETYEKESMVFYNLFIRQIPSEKEIQQINNEVTVKIKEFKQELDVRLAEKINQIREAESNGDIISERAKLEIQNAKSMAETAIAEKQQEFISMAHDAALRIIQQVVSDKEYEIMIENPDIAKNIVSAIKFNDYRIKVTASIGSDVFLYETYLEESRHYPIIPLPYMHTGTPYPMSAIIPMIGKQQEINKAHQIMIHNANLSSNVRWLHQEGAINEKDWEDMGTVPGARLKYRVGFDAPIPVQPAPLNNAFYTVTAEGKADIEYIAGIQASMMGVSKDQPETYKGLLANDEYGTRRIKAWMNSVVEPCLEHLGRVFKDYAQKTYTIDKVFRIVQPEAGSDEVREARVNIPIYNDYGEAIGKWNDYESAQFDVRIVSGATLPLNRWALLEEYFRWFQAGLIDDQAMIAETDIRNKERLVERNSMYAKMRDQLEQADAAIKDLKGENETLKRQLVQLGIRHKVDESDKRIEKATLKTEQQQRLMREVARTEIQSFVKDLEREKKKQRDEFDSLKKKEQNNKQNT